jgi:hypothetical protein
MLISSVILLLPLLNKLLNWYDFNIYIINIIADDEIKIDMH